MSRQKNCDCPKGVACSRAKSQSNAWVSEDGITAQKLGVLGRTLIRGEVSTLFSSPFDQFGTMLCHSRGTTTDYCYKSWTKIVLRLADSSLIVGMKWFPKWIAECWSYNTHKTFPFSDVTPPELKCPDDVLTEALPDRHYALINISTPFSTGKTGIARATKKATWTIVSWMPGYSACEWGSLGRIIALEWTIPMSCSFWCYSSLR